jgi:hypothetical protein
MAGEINAALGNIAGTLKTLETAVAKIAAPAAAPAGPAAGNAAPAADNRAGLAPGDQAKVALDDPKAQLQTLMKELTDLVGKLTEIMGKLVPGGAAPAADGKGGPAPAGDKAPGGAAPAPGGDKPAAGGPADKPQDGAGAAKPVEAGAIQKELAPILAALSKLMKMLTELLMKLLSDGKLGGEGKGGPTAPPEIKGTVGPGWLVNHGDYQKQPNGTYSIVKGPHAGSTAVPQGGGKYSVVGPNGEQKGTYTSPTGQDKIASPLVFDLNGDGKASTTSVAGGKQFDIDGDGKVDQTAWAGKGDGVLAFDGNGDGKAGTDGTELFGNNTVVDGKKFDNGFEALKAVAKKHLGDAAIADGKLDAAELKTLGEKAGLTMLVDGQQKSLADAGVSEIKLGYTEAGRNADANGNEHRQVGAGATVRGNNAAVNDVWFKYR